MKLTIQHRAELKKIIWKGAGFGSIRKGKKAFARRVNNGNNIFDTVGRWPLLLLLVCLIATGARAEMPYYRPTAEAKLGKAGLPENVSVANLSPAIELRISGFKKPSLLFSHCVCGRNQKMNESFWCYQSTFAPSRPISLDGRGAVFDLYHTSNLNIVGWRIARVFDFQLKERVIRGANDLTFSDGDVCSLSVDHTILSNFNTSPRFPESVPHGFPLPVTYGGLYANKNKPKDAKQNGVPFRSRQRLGRITLAAFLFLLYPLFSWQGFRLLLLGEGGGGELLYSIALLCGSAVLAFCGTCFILAAIQAKQDGQNNSNTLNLK